MRKKIITRHAIIRDIDFNLEFRISLWRSTQNTGEHMRLQAGKQFYKLVVVAWLTFSLGSVVLGLVLGSPGTELEFAL